VPFRLFFGPAIHHNTRPAGVSRRFVTPPKVVA